MLIGSPTNRSASCGRVVFPNLGYKKDAFLELSLVSNNSSSHPTNQQTTIPTLNISDFESWPTPTTNKHPTSPLVLLTLLPLGILLVLEFLGFLLQLIPLDVREWLLLSRTGIFHTLFALFFLTFTNTILQTRSYHPHHTRSNPFRLLTQFTEGQENACIEPMT